MNVAASSMIARGFLKGYFDVIDAMLGVASTHETPALRPLPPAQLADALKTKPVVMTARVKSGGGVLMAFSIRDASQLVTLVLNGTAAEKGALDAGDLATLKETADPCLGGGISNLQETFGRELELKELQVFVTGSETAPNLATLFGEAMIEAQFAYTVPSAWEGEAVLVFTEDLEGLVPAELTGVGSPEAAPQSVNSASDTASRSMTAGQGNSMMSSSVSGGQAGQPVPGNLDMVLDIRLVATARLGHIEMPIGEILALGPGSIFQVDRTVDEPVDLLINDKLIARGDIVVVDEKFGLRITEIVSAKERIESLR